MSNGAQLPTRSRRVPPLSEAAALRMFNAHDMHASAVDEETSSPRGEAMRRGRWL